MYGTVGRAHVRPENRDKLVEAFRDPVYGTVPGYRSAQLMFPENRPGEVIIAVWFEDAASYWRNADDPAQDARYREFRALLEDDPEWSDGDWIEGATGSA